MCIRDRNIGVFASVKNAFVITNYSGYDPEINSFAFDGLRPVSYTHLGDDRIEQDLKWDRVVLFVGIISKVM